MAYSGYRSGYGPTSSDGGGGGLAPGVLTVDQSTPAGVSGVGVTSLVTGTFTPPAGALLLAVSSWDTSSTGRSESASTDQGSTTVWQRIRNDSSAGSGLAAIDWAVVQTSGPTRVRSTWDGGATSGMLQVFVIGGAATTRPVGANGSVVATSASTPVPWRTTVPGSRLFAVYADAAGGAVATNADMTRYQAVSSIGTFTTSAWVQSASATSGGASASTTFSSTNPGSIVSYVELVPVSFVAAGALSGGGTLIQRGRGGSGAASGSGALAAALAVGTPERSFDLVGEGSLSAAVSSVVAFPEQGMRGSGQVVGYGGPTLEQYVYVPVPAQPPSRQVEWRYIAQHVLSGRILHTSVPLATEGPSWALSGPGSLVGTVSPETARLLDDAGAPLLQEWGTAIYAEANGQIRWGGILIRSGFNGAAWELEFAGFSTYLHGTPYTGEVYERIQQDPMDIVQYLWDWVQRQPDGNLRMRYSLPEDCPVRLGVPKVPAYVEVKLAGSTEWVPKSSVPSSQIIASASSPLAKAVDSNDRTLTLKSLSNFGKTKLPFVVSVGSEHMTVTSRSGLKLNVTRAADKTKATGHSKGTAVKYTGTPTRTAEAVEAEPYSLSWWDATDVGEELDKLAQETPFDYVEEHSWVDDPEEGLPNIEHRFVVSYPRRGRKRTDLAFAQGGNIVEVVSATRDGDDFANVVQGLGAGEGAKSVRTEVAVRDGRLRRVSVYTDKTATTTARLSALARSEWQRRQLLPEVSSITVTDHPNARIGSWSVGDDILVRADLPWLGYVEVWSRITAWQLQGETRAVLTLERSDNFAYGQAVESVPPPLPAPATISPDVGYAEPHIAGPPPTSLFVELAHLPKGMAMTLMSSSDWDPLTGDWYQAQQSGDDMLIHRFDPTGRWLSYMRCKDAGHGNQIGVERTGSSLYIWAMWETPKGSRSLRRLKYAAATRDSGDAQKIKNGYASTTYQAPALDQENNTICLRATTGGRNLFRVYSLSDMLAGRVKQLGKTIDMGSTESATYQGHAIAGDSLYRITNIKHLGREPNTEEDWRNGTDVPNWIEEWNWRTGVKLAQNDYRRAAHMPEDPFLFKIEPEGLAVVIRYGVPVLVANFKTSDGALGTVDEQVTRMIAITPVPTS